ncbi:phage shock protein PspA [Alteromonas sp. ASW11-19]|uniref:Phage shock protein PspA n=1 Tax=Alteromonas salexigens TaxID=2982530 RepID=A0ABT2VKF2_9ALTE|nr:phage shock protein PspA [Alteromonas salexigens]MCU7553756.1 phage shock protein PspA [Alteromonas salexigens]
MGMFSRMTDIVQANINAMLDKAEDPEKVIRLIIQEMEETLVEIRSEAAKFLAEQKHLDRQLQRVNKEVTGWQEKAQLAIDKDKETLARAALAEKQRYAQQAESLQQQHDTISESLAQLQGDTGRLNEKLAEAKAKQKAMVTRQHSASVRLKVKAVEHSDKINHAMARFDQYEQRIDQLEAQVDAYEFTGSATQPHSLDAQFRALEENDAIERELNAMKKNKAA